MIQTLQITGFYCFQFASALFGANVTEEADAAVPDHFLIDNGKFLMDIRFVHQVDPEVTPFLVASFQAVKSIF
jgi:hypothetical protein